MKKWLNLKSPAYQLLTIDALEKIRTFFEYTNYKEPRPLDVPQLSELFRHIDALTQENADLRARIAERRENDKEARRLLRTVLNSDMAMREEDEGNVSSLLQDIRSMLGE